MGAVFLPVFKTFNVAGGVTTANSSVFVSVVLNVTLDISTATVTLVSAGEWQLRDPAV